MPDADWNIIIYGYINRISQYFYKYTVFVKLLSFSVAEQQSQHQMRFYHEL